MKQLVSLAVLLMLLVSVGCTREDSGAADAPKRSFGWRGDGTGRFAGANPPDKWNEENDLNILWTAEVGSGQSSPVIAGNRVFVCSEPDKLVCVDAASGKVLWSRGNGLDSLPKKTSQPDDPRPTDPGCGYTTPTPVTDGTHVYATYGTGIVVCYDLSGKRKWVRYIDLPQMTEYGRSASPLLADGKLIVSINHLMALDPKTGKTIWQAKKATPSFGTPAVMRLGGENLLITPMGDIVRLIDGTILQKDVGMTDYASPIVIDDVVLFTGATTTASRLTRTADGKVNAEEVWEAEMEGEFYSSPVLHEGIVYTVCNEGMLFALDAKGKTIWRKELDIPSAAGGGAEMANIYGSLAIAGNRLFLVNDIGTCLVLEPGKVYKEVSQNELDEGSGASPVADGKRLYLRGGDFLYCIGKK